MNLYHYHSILFAKGCVLSYNSPFCDVSFEPANIQILATVQPLHKKPVTSTVADERIIALGFTRRIAQRLHSHPPSDMDERGFEWMEHGFFHPYTLLQTFLMHQSNRNSFHYPLRTSLTPPLHHRHPPMARYNVPRVALHKGCSPLL